MSPAPPAETTSRLEVVLECLAQTGAAGILVLVLSVGAFATWFVLLAKRAHWKAFGVMALVCLLLLVLGMLTWGSARESMLGYTLGTIPFTEKMHPRQVLMILQGDLLLAALVCGIIVPGLLALFSIGMIAGKPQPR